MEVCKIFHSDMCKFFHGWRITQIFSICAILENVGLCGFMWFYVGLMGSMGDCGKWLVGEINILEYGNMSDILICFNILICVYEDMVI